MEPAEAGMRKRPLQVIGDRLETCGVGPAGLGLALTLLANVPTGTLPEFYRDPDAFIIWDRPQGLAVSSIEEANRPKRSRGENRSRLNPYLSRESGR